MIDTLLMRLRARDTVSEAEEEALRALIRNERHVPADQVIVTEGEELSGSTLLIEGLICRYKDLKNGERQITAVHVSGDFVDLPGFSLKRLDHNIMTLTPCLIATAPHAGLGAITETHPHLTRLLWFLTNRDAAMHREWEVSLGRRTAEGRMAHLLCELHARLEVIGQAGDTGFALPLTQAELAECLGLTPVHVNRTLRLLRERGLAEFRDKHVTLLDLAGLRRVAEFRDTYLFLEKRPQ
jgi:CRP-like cAMP-binding protein